MGSIALQTSLRFRPLAQAPEDGETPASAEARRKLSEEKKRHLAHQAHTGLDLARLGERAPHLAAEIGAILSKNPHLNPSTRQAMVKLADQAPDLAETVFSTIEHHPTLSRPMLNAVPKLVQVHGQVLTSLKKSYPQLSDRALSKITQESIARGIGKALPVVGVGLAAWGTLDTLKAAIDPRLSSTTKGLYAAANSADWGAAMGGVFAESGIGEVAAISAAIASIGLYAKAEASKEVDLEGKEQPPGPSAYSILRTAPGADFAVEA